VAVAAKAGVIKNIIDVQHLLSHLILDKPVAVIAVVAVVAGVKNINMAVPNPNHHQTQV
jgi:hypothetical protein